MQPSRRQALVLLAGMSGVERAAAAGHEALAFAGQPVQLHLLAMSERTLRVTLSSAEAGAQENRKDPVLARSDPGVPILKPQSISGSRVVHWGSKRIAITPKPLAVTITNRQGK